jgi:hypothetical protein
MKYHHILFIVGAAVVASSPGVPGQQSSQPPLQQTGAPSAERKPGESVQFQVPPMPELPNEGLGETDQPLIPGQKWRIRDLNRPKPVAVTPGAGLGQPPSDAIILFDGKDLSQWTVSAFGGRGARGAVPGAGTSPAANTPAQTPSATTWKVENGYMEMVPGAGSLASKERFKDFQLHIEFASPPVPLGKSQYRGNSGITIGGREIQILDNYRNETYADGYVGAVYNQWPPLVNPSRPPGEWQTLDIAYMSPRYDGERLVRNAYITVFLNGVMIHNNREIFPTGRGGGRGPAPSSAAPGGAGQLPVPPAPPATNTAIGLMGHPSAIRGNAVRYGNIWVRRVDVELPSEPIKPQQP